MMAVIGEGGTLFGGQCSSERSANSLSPEGEAPLQQGLTSRRAVLVRRVVINPLLRVTITSSCPDRERKVESVCQRGEATPWLDERVPGGSSEFPECPEPVLRPRYASESYRTQAQWPCREIVARRRARLVTELRGYGRVKADSQLHGAKRPKPGPLAAF